MVHFRKKRNNYDCKIGIVAIIKNEGPYLSEWVDFHISQGIEKILLFDNESNDDTAKILEPDIENGKVEYHLIHGKARQTDVYNIALKMYNDFGLLAFFDCDEFLFCMNDTLAHYINEFLKDNVNCIYSWIDRTGSVIFAIAKNLFFLGKE